MALTPIAWHSQSARALTPIAWYSPFVSFWVMNVNLWRTGRMPFAPTVFFVIVINLLIFILIVVIIIEEIIATTQIVNATDQYR